MRSRAIRELGILSLLLLAVTAHAATVEDKAGAAAWLGTYVWRLDDPRFGGFSGIEVADDGGSFTALSDRAELIRGTITRDDQGRITGVTAGGFSPILGARGQDLPGTMGDSEGLAVASDGTIYISFEFFTRVARYTGPGGKADVLPRPPWMKAMRNNTSLEALAIDPRGWLYTLPESATESAYPIWRFAGGRWTQVASLPRSDDFVPVGADFGPDGRFYLLERQFVFPFGFRSRVRSFLIGDAGLSDPRLVIDSPTGDFDNLEGLAVWRDRQGRVRLTMVSDDNFSLLQRTELVEFALP